MTGIIILALLAAAPAKGGKTHQAPAARPVQTKPAETKPAEEKKEEADAPAPADATWEFDEERAHVVAHGDANDDVTRLALSQMGVTLDGDAYFKVSAHENSVGGVTLRLADYNDAKSTCDLYATRKGDTLEFSDSRCSFSAFQGSAKTTATCRKISGSARRLKQGVAFTATAPDCTAQPMGFSLSGKANVKPYEDKK